LLGKLGGNATSSGSLGRETAPRRRGIVTIETAIRIPGLIAHFWYLRLAFPIRHICAALQLSMYCRS
jgi:hypothetical protein